MINILYNNTCLPVTGKQHNWSRLSLTVMTRKEQLGHDYYNSPDTLLGLVRKGQIESSIHQATKWTQGHIQHLSFQIQAK